MPGYWLVKTGPSTYSFDDLNREGVTTWDGVKNPVAMNHLRAMRPGDEVLIYHTGYANSVLAAAQVLAAAASPNMQTGRPRARPHPPPPVPPTLSLLAR